jgi:long-chain acyl-CoA synthetase
MSDTNQTPKNFSVDRYNSFAEVFHYNEKYLPSSKTFAQGRDERKLSYGRLFDLTAKLHTWFASENLKRNDRVIILSQDGLAVITLFMACLRYGLTAVIVGPDSGEEEQLNLIKAAKPSALFMDDVFYKKLSGLPDTPRLSIEPHVSYSKAGMLGKLMGQKHADSAMFPAMMDQINAAIDCEDTPVPLDTVAYILFTSGTTSRPKGVEITHGNLLAQIKTFVRHYGYTAQSNLLNILPLHHTDGLTQGPVVAFTAGASVYRPLRFAINYIPQLMDSIYKYRITHFIAVPAMLQLIDSLGVKDQDVFKNENFKFIISTAGYLDPNLWQRFESNFGTMIVNVYGLTETVCEALYCGPTEDTRRIGTIGKPIDTEVRICDEHGNDVAAGQEGELWVKGDHIMKGYFEMPDETAEVLTDNGWFKTGDLCKKDDEGFFHIVGRKKNVIIVGGINVYPDDVANILRALPGVMDAVVWGENDDTWGETVNAAIIPEQNNNIDTNKLSEQFLDQAAVEMLPRQIHIVSDFPRGPAGKVIVRELQSRIAGKAANDAQTASANQLEAQVITVASRSFKCAEADLSLSSTAETTKGWSSLAHVEFLLSLEKEFGIKVEPKDILSVRSIGDALKVVQDKIGEAA